MSKREAKKSNLPSSIRLSKIQEEKVREFMEKTNRPFANAVDELVRIAFDKQDKADEPNKEELLRITKLELEIEVLKKKSSTPPGSVPPSSPGSEPPQEYPGSGKAASPFRSDDILNLQKKIAKNELVMIHRHQTYMNQAEQAFTCLRCQDTHLSRQLCLDCYGRNRHCIECSGTGVVFEECHACKMRAYLPRRVNAPEKSGGGGGSL